MKDTGIARRVDQLGRIVLPMEIRKKLKINEGTLLSLSLDNDVICLKKYSPLLDFKGYVEDILKLCENVNFFLCDDNKIIYANKNFKSYIDTNIDISAFEHIKDFGVIENKLILSETFISSYTYHYIFSIKKDGDLFGYLCFAFMQKPTDEVIGACKFISKYVSSKL